MASKRPFLGLLLAVLAAPLAGQDHPVEVGVDAAVKLISVSDGARAQTRIEFPVDALRIGIGVAPYLAIEISGSFDRTTEDDDSEAELFLFPSVVLSGSADGGVGAFVALGAGMRHVRSDDGVVSQSDTQLGFGGQFGLRAFPSESFAIRLALARTHWLDAELLPSLEMFTFTVGFSAFP
jgi:hypothetical protein